MNSTQSPSASPECDNANILWLNEWIYNKNKVHIQSTRLWFEFTKSCKKWKCFGDNLKNKRKNLIFQNNVCTGPYVDTFLNVSLSYTMPPKLWMFIVCWAFALKIKYIRWIPIGNWYQSHWPSSSSNSSNRSAIRAPNSWSKKDAVITQLDPNTKIAMFNIFIWSAH